MTREELAMTGNFTICVGTVGSGAWLSPDGGESWRRVGKGLWSESRVFGLSLHPREPRTLFAGANDGVYKSTDGGQSFERLDSPMNDLDVWRVAVDPADPDIIFAGTRPAALFRSKDGGAHWQKLAADIPEEWPNVRVPPATAWPAMPGRSSARRMAARAGKCCLGRRSPIRRSGPLGRIGPTPASSSRAAITASSSPAIKPATAGRSCAANSPRSAPSAGSRIDALPNPPPLAGEGRVGLEQIPLALVHPLTQLPVRLGFPAPTLRHPLPQGGGGQ